jgi:hypothetical protein
MPLPDWWVYLCTVVAVVECVRWLALGQQEAEEQWRVVVGAAACCNCRLVVGDILLIVRVVVCVRRCLGARVYCVCASTHDVVISVDEELIMKPLVVSRTGHGRDGFGGERILVEGSINSLRISIKIKQADDIEVLLCKKFVRFLEQRAEQFFIMRRKPVAVC